jgi:putative transposase
MDPSCFINPPPGFQGLHPTKAIRIYSRNLPHWRQEGATYFITFRQQDSIPPHVWRAMQEELRKWKVRSEEEEARNGGTLPTEFMDQWEQFQRRHLVKLEREVDACHGTCVLARAECREVMVNALMIFDKDRYDLHAFVVMPNHVHLAVTPRSGWNLPELLKSLKGFTAREINKKVGRTGSLWQPESFDRIIRDASHFEKVIRYIMRNPEKARLDERKSALWIADGVVERVGSARLQEEAVEYGSDMDVW